MRGLVIAGALAVGLATLPLASADAGGTWRVTLKPSVETVVVGHKVVLTGHVRPSGAAAGGKVSLQEKFKPGTPWKTRQSATVTSSGTYKLVTKPTTGFTHAYRVVMPATKSHAKGISPTVKVKVYAWVDLIDLTWVNDVGMFFQPVNINGTTYPSSVLAAYTDIDNSVEFNVNHDCTAMRSTFGLADNSTTGGQGEISVQADGTPVYGNTFDVGQSETKTITFDPAPLKIRLEGHNTSTTNGVYGEEAFGTPQALCSN